MITEGQPNSPERWAQIRRENARRQSTSKPFVVGDRVFNTGNRNRKIIGIITDTIDFEFCTVLWSDGEGYAHHGKIRRDGDVEYRVPGHEQDRIVRVKLSVRIPQEV